MRDDYLALFDELAHRYSLMLTEDGEETRQRLSEADLVEVARQFQVVSQSAGPLRNGHGLDEASVACLTRIVRYHKRVYRNPSLEIEVDIKLCNDNSFPVLGSDLWTKGCSSLPAGMAWVSAPNDTAAAQIVNSIRAFKQNPEEDIQSTNAE